MFAEFLIQPDSSCAQRFFEQWYNNPVMRFKLEPLKKVARMIQSHLSGPLNCFDYPITNATAEGFNSRIQSLKVAARDFRAGSEFVVAR